MLAEITPDQHHISQAFFERQNLKSHWITSFALVEHDRSMTPFIAPVQSWMSGMCLRLASNAPTIALAKEGYMAELQLYLPLIGLAAFIFGAIRIFTRADITAGEQRKISPSHNTEGVDAPARLIKALTGSESRLDLVLMGLGVLLIVGFIASVELS
ncbi:hypothetical protein [Devosia ginsengisoli]|uniref:Uncharacterized protein n=1 Tax=Devosia ginsengisoli TaxID=400770 RepID=A0A5B8LU73_9HYPH|nr:hypothetical protein [Devosia ginsengisoli]QDZ11847.1 hypothetical protein FPZ08_14515 [Devosia ginsengisoli]